MREHEIPKRDVLEGYDVARACLRKTEMCTARVDQV